MDELRIQSTHYPLTRPVAPKKNKVYQNDMQTVVQSVWSNITGVRAGRGTGKTALLSGHTLKCNQSIVRGTDVMLGNSYAQVYGRTMPAMVKEIEQTWHWREGVHFFRGHAPKSANFPEPLAKPRTWSNAIHWYTGAVTLLCSMAVKGSTNGLSITSCRLDEARYSPWSHVQEEVMPAIRASVYDHPGWKTTNPALCSFWAVSDGALSNAQAVWEEKMQALITPEIQEVNDAIAQMLAELEVARIGGWYDELAANEEFKRKINTLRHKSINFYSFSSVENLEVLGGEEWLKKQKRLLSPLEFSIQLMNAPRGVGKADSYYANFSEDIHCYTPDQTLEEDLIKDKYNRKFKSIIDIGGMTKKVDYITEDLEDLARASSDCSLDVDCKDGLPLYITLDTNKNINTFCIAQRYIMQGRDSMVVLKTMYVLNEKRLRTLCKEFDMYYDPHKASCKDIIFYYDATNKASNYALEEQEQLRFYNVVKEELEKRGWKVSLVDMGDTMDHDPHFQMTNDAFTGAFPFVVRINKYHNDFLICSLNTTKLIKTGNFIRKNKTREKLTTALDANDMPANQITDMSDAFDNMIRGFRFFPRGTRKWGLTGIPLFGIDIY